MWRLISNERLQGWVIQILGGSLLVACFVVWVATEMETSLFVGASLTLILIGQHRKDSGDAE